MSQRENIARIKAVYNALEELATEVTFVGGATVSLYADRPAGEARPTDDVDIVIELTRYKDYAAIEEKLRSKGFVNDQESGVLCRYQIQGITVDVMPTEENVLGFKNQWYPDGFANSMLVDLDEDYSISVFSPPYFIASKLDAFVDRGEGDGRMSTDFEDIVFVLNNRNAIWDEMNGASEKVKEYLKEEFKKLVQEPYIDEWVSSHLDYNEQRRVGFILGSIQEFLGAAE